MKKLHFLAAAVILITCFNACDKDQLGVYNPKMKLHQIYYEKDNRYLMERWFWNGEQLAKINHYRRNDVLDYTQNYIYDGKRLARIESENEYSEFLYEGNKLTTINTYQETQLLETYMLSYDGKKLSHIDIDVKGNGHGKCFILSSILPLNPDMMEAYVSHSDSKRERYDFSKASIDFSWEGDNITFMKMHLTRPDSIQHLIFSYVYDNNINPMNGFFTMYLDHQLLNDQPQYMFCSKNNATAVMVTDQYDVFSRSVSYTYSYDYYKKYPTKVYSTFIGIDNNTGMYKTDSLLMYSYQYQ